MIPCFISSWTRTLIFFLFIRYVYHIIITSATNHRIFVNFIVLIAQWKCYFSAGEFVCASWYAKRHPNSTRAALFPWQSTMSFCSLAFWRSQCKYKCSFCLYFRMFVCWGTIYFIYYMTENSRNFASTFLV